MNISTLLSCARRRNYDIIFLNAQIIDGTGTQAYEGDSAITDEKIVKIGNCKRDRSETIIDSNYFRYKIEFLIRYVKFIKTP